MRDESKEKFMAIRDNVIQKRKQLRKELTPTQYYLLEDIMLGTVNEWASEAKFDLDDMAEAMGYKTRNKIYNNLKVLHQKGLIVRKPTKYPGLEIMGLNPKAFGQVLINHQHDIEKRKHIKIVVNNSAEECPKKTGEVPKKDSSSDQKGRALCPNRAQLPFQDTEIIDEKFPLDSYRYIKTSSDVKELNAQVRETEGEWTDPALVRKYCSQIFKTIEKETG